MGDPLVSVLMPIYNGERWLKESVESVLAQTYPHVELIMINDHSPDGSGALADSLARANVKVIHNAKNAGINGSRNFGLAQAQGQYIALLDQDDLWLPDKLKEQIALLERNPAADLVYSDAYYATDVAHPSKRSFQMCDPHRGHVHPDLLRKNFIPTLTVLFNRNLLQESGLFDVNYWACADYEMIVRLCRKANVDYVDKPLGVYRVHANSYTAKNQERQYIEIIRILKAENAAVTADGISMDRDGMVANLYLRLARLGWKRSAFAEAMRFFKDGLSHVLRAPVEFLRSLQRDQAERKRLKAIEWEKL